MFAARAYSEQVAPDTGRRPSEGYDRQPLAWIGDHIRPASGHVPHIGSLKPQAGEPKLTKTSHNAFPDGLSNTRQGKRIALPRAAGIGRGEVVPLSTRRARS